MPPRPLFQPPFIGTPLNGRRYRIALGLLTLSYFLSAKLGLMLAVSPGSASPVWPPAGLAVAALFHFGAKLWPAILIGEILAVTNDGLPLSVALGMGIGNVMEALAASLLIQRFGHQGLFLGKARDMLIFLGGSALLGGSIGASCGVASLTGGGIVPSEAVATTWLTWWLGDAAGMVIVTPLLLSWLNPNPPEILSARWETVLLFAVGLGLSMSLFGGWLPVTDIDYPLVILLLPLLVWGSFRLPSRELTLVNAALSTVAILGTAQGWGPFVREDSTLSLLLLQLYTGTLAGTSLVLSAILQERARAFEALQNHRAKLEERIAEATDDLRQANARIEREHHFLQVVQDTMPTLLVVMDNNGNILTFNHACQSATGFTERDALGKKPWDLLIPPEQATSVKAVFNNLTAGMFPNEYQNEWLTRAGERIQTDWRNTAITDPDGAVKYVVATGSDVTEQQETRQALVQATVEWGYAMDFLDDAICIAGSGHRLTRANRAFCEMTGHTQKSALGRDVTQLLCPQRTDDDQSPLRRLIEQNGDGTLSLEAHDPDNPTDHPVEITVGVIHDRSGECKGRLIALHDLRHARRTEAELQRLNDHLRLLLESTGEGIYGIDRHGFCTFINQAGADILGYRVSEPVGRHMHHLVHHSREDGSDYPFEECPIYHTLQEGQAVRSEADVLWRENGDAVPVNYSANPVIENGIVSGAVVVFRDVAEARAMAKRMDYLASHDPLTGLFNRHVFEQHLERALESAQEEQRSHLLCYLDLDQFKLINDTCGHTAGDELLRQLAPLLEKRIRRSDMLARLGGDEFGVLLESCGLERGMQVVNELRETVQEYRFAWESKTFSLGVSIGVVAIDRHSTGPAAVLSAADSACYVAKDSGRNRVHIYREQDAELARRHGEMQWVSRLQSALEEDRLLLYAQQIVPVHEQINGEHIEILLRLQDESGETVPPGAFIPAAERYNLMPAVDRRVLEKAFNWLSDNPRCLEHLSFCAVNLSGHTLSNPDFLAFVVQRAAECRIPPVKICFEITETAAVANLSAAAHFITELKGHGFRFALDDFGSGMSSFAYLKNLPVDFLKIDGNFVRDIAKDNIDRAMVTAINQVGQVMGLKTIAEFVEHDAILGHLRQIGVDYAQGYGIGRPMPLEDMDCSR